MEESRRPVSLILADAIRETDDCAEQLAQVIRDCEAALIRAQAEHKEAAAVLKGLQKLHIQSTKSIRRKERSALTPGEAPEQRNKLPKGTATAKLMECLRTSLDMLTKEQILEATDLDPRAIGVTLGHAVRGGTIIEREGLYGLAQKLDSADNEHESLAASAASNGR